MITKLSACTDTFNFYLFYFTYAKPIFLDLPLLRRNNNIQCKPEIIDVRPTEFLFKLTLYLCPE